MCAYNHWWLEVPQLQHHCAHCEEFQQKQLRYHSSFMKTTCKFWLAVVSKDKWVAQSYVRERHCLFGPASLPPNSASDSESASSPASCSVASCDCWENVFSIVLFLCSIFALGVFDRLFSFFWAALMTGMSDISCDSLHDEKNEGNIYSLLPLQQVLLPQ